MRRVHAHYWRCQRQTVNFGDGLVEPILAKMGYAAVTEPQPGARCLLSIGSDLRYKYVRDLRESYGANPVVVWGTGYSQGNPPDNDDCDIRAVRGPLTRDTLCLPPDLPLGDPGFLMPTFYPMHRSGRGPVLAVPHWHNRAARAWPEYQNMDVEMRRDEVLPSVRRLLHAEFVLTTALHVCIMCLAYGVPFAPAIRPGEEVDKPQKWADLFGLLQAELRWSRDESQGRAWHEAVGCHIRVPNIEPLLSAFPHDIYA